MRIPLDGEENFFMGFLPAVHIVGVFLINREMSGIFAIPPQLKEQRHLVN
jgi:hypothetical protein